MYRQEVGEVTIDHIAIWTDKLEEMREFYCRCFKGRSNEKYINPLKGFESYFITFDGGARLELMRRSDIPKGQKEVEEIIGITHFAFKLNSKEEVDTLTETLRRAGYFVAGEPRTTGDGYYESVVLDPEGNRVELVG